MKVCALGEITFDIIFKDGRPVDSKVGGSVVNTLVSLGRQGVPVRLIAASGFDEVGLLTREFLKSNGIDISRLSVYQGTSRIALAFLDKKNNATYSFYNGLNRNNLPLVFPSGISGGLVLFGSSFGIKPEVRAGLVRFLDKARTSGSLVYYDPNIRANTFSNNERAKEWIVENIKFSNIVKGSIEDFEAIFGSNHPQEAYNAVKRINPDVVLLVTSGKDGADLFTPVMNEHYDVPQIIPVSTIGAGDAFSAGIIYGLHLANADNTGLDSLHKNKWLKVVEWAIKFSSEVCLSYDNYIEADKPERI